MSNMEESEEIISDKRKKELMILPIHFGKMVYTEYFSTFDASIKKGESLLIKSERGTEIGTALTPPKPAEQFKGNIFGKVVRHSRITERSKQATLRDGKERELKFIASNLAKEQSLDMKIQDVEYILGGERVIFYFTSNGRVDFRNLVKSLAGSLHTRIEMRQIGFRDNAKLFGGFGKCGLTLCCSTWLKDYPDVNIKMAILQKGSSEQNKVSGQCGKLMCCLQYEDGLYQELKKNLPSRGQIVKTKTGEGEVINVDILNQKVTFVTTLREYITITPDSILETLANGKSDESHQ
jgi:cell fate regulator YaaT (PSP1 superfamily)